MHGVDVEGMQLGIDDQLVQLLGKWSPIPVTYAGGARTLVRSDVITPPLDTFPKVKFLVDSVPATTNWPRTAVA